MAADVVGRVAMLWRGDREARANTTAESSNRLRPIFDALAALDVAAEPAVFAEEMADDVRDQLLGVDGVLVWVDPISGDRDRSTLDDLLLEIASSGVWVSAHPDVILKMGTKEVLFATKELGWGADTHLYRSVQELKDQLPQKLASGPRVLKQHRGNGGIGVWKVELTPGQTPSLDAVVRAQNARTRDTATEDLRLSEFIAKREHYFTGSGRIIDQPFQPRLTDGMIRCYMVRDELVGFAHQSPKGLLGEAGDGSPTPQVLGLPSDKAMFGSDEPAFQRLRAKVESEWVPAMQRLVDVDVASLPLLWDADFLYGPRTESGEDTYVLCEINVSAVSPFPEQAVQKLAKAVVARIEQANAVASAESP